MLKKFLFLAFVLLTATSLFAQDGICSNTTLSNTLGASGPYSFTVFSLGGPGSLLNINLATVNGTVGVANPGVIQESAPSTVTGPIVVGSQVNTSGVRGANGGIVVDDATVSQAAADAFSAAAAFAAMSATPSVQSQFPSNGQVLQNLTVTGTVGVNVVNLSNFRLDNHATLTLTGPAGTAFVINDSGNFNLHAGNIQLGGGVLPFDVVYNITNPNAVVTTMVPTTGVGILLAPYNRISSMDSATYTGEVIGGYGETVVLMSATNVTNPCNQGGGGGPR